MFEHLVSAYDFMPSLLDYLGTAASKERHRVDQSYAPLLKRKPYRECDEIFFEYGYVRSIRSKRWKYNQRVDGYPSELFDLQKDPGEKTNVLDTPEGKQLEARMSPRLRAFFERAGAPPPEKWRTTTRQTLPTYGRAGI